MNQAPFSPDMFQLPKAVDYLSIASGTDHIERQLREKVSAAITEFYDRILEWVDDYAKREGVTLEELKRRGHDLIWQDGSVQFIRIENGAFKVLKGFRLEIGTNETVPFIGNVN